MCSTQRVKNVGPSSQIALGIIPVPVCQVVANMSNRVLNVRLADLGEDNGLGEGLDRLPSDGWQVLVSDQGPQAPCQVFAWPRGPRLLEEPDVLLRGTRPMDAGDCFLSLGLVAVRNCRVRPSVLVAMQGLKRLDEIEELRSLRQVTLQHGKSVELYEGIVAAINISPRLQQSGQYETSRCKIEDWSSSRLSPVARIFRHEGALADPTPE